MPYAIIRTAKLKHLASVRRSLKHSLREQDTPNADPEQTPANSHFGAHSVEEAMGKVEGLLPEKRRKDAVLAVEYLVTASPEAMQGKTREQQDAYYRDALEWIKERHGAANVVYAGIHRDETTPHLYAYAVPLDPDSGRLNAKRWLGGAKALNEMQTDFARDVGERHSLERGIERSRARHVPIREYYARVGAVERREPAVDVPAPSMGDRLNPRAYGERVARSVVEQLGPRWKELSAKAVELDVARRQAREAQETAKALNRQWAPLAKALKPLTPDERQQIVQAASMASDGLVARRQSLQKQPEPLKAKTPEKGSDR